MVYKGPLRLKPFYSYIYIQNMSLQYSKLQSSHHTLFMITLNRDRLEKELILTAQKIG